MEMNVLDKTKDVEIWLTRAEKNDPQLRAQLKERHIHSVQDVFLLTVNEQGQVYFAAKAVTP